VIPLKNTGATLRKSIFKALVLILLPCLEYLALRYYLHSILNLHIGWNAALTDFNLLIPVPLAFTVFIILLDRSEKLTLSVKIPETIFHVSALATFLLVNQCYVWLLSRFGLIFQIFWWGGALAVFTSSVGLWGGVKYYWKNPNRSSLLICLMIAFTSVLTGLFIEYPWKSIVEPLARLICGALHPFLGSSIQCGVQWGNQLLLVHPAFATRIASACGGFDGYVLMYVVLALVSTLAARALVWWEYLTFGILGFLMMTVLNVVRIAALFFIGLTLVQRQGWESGSRIFEIAFHANLGWILYTVGLYQFGRLILAWKDLPEDSPGSALRGPHPVRHPRGRLPALRYFLLRK
jgi:exosortase/archaeosortase family protein